MFLLVWLLKFLKKKDKTKFSWLALLIKHFFIKIQPNMSKKKNNKMFMICLTPELSKNIFSEMLRVSLWPPSSQDFILLD